MKHVSIPRNERFVLLIGHSILLFGLLYVANLVAATDLVLATGVGIFWLYFLYQTLRVVCGQTYNQYFCGGVLLFLSAACTKMLFDLPRSIAIEEGLGIAGFTVVMIVVGALHIKRW